MAKKIQSRLSVFLKDYRRRNALMAKEVAEELGISTIYYSRIENGLIHFSPLLARKMAKFLNMPINELTALLEEEKNG